MEWLYLGQADYLLLHNKMPVEAGQKILWETRPKSKQFPELELAAEFKSVPNETYGSWARLYRFHPQPEKLARLEEKYPWAGTHPREALAVKRNR